MIETPTDFVSFHHIVVGGAAGCVPANRLGADPARRVLLLEARERLR
jgi:choline dehydrogenase-like flavoprotein